MTAVTSQKRHGLNEKDIDLIKKCIMSSLSKHPIQSLDVWLFGSRAQGTHRQYSDIDLLISVMPPLSASEKANIEALFEESGLPYKVDVVTIEDLAPDYQSGVEKERILLFSVTK